MKFIKVYNTREKNFELGKETWERKKGVAFSLCSCKTCIKKATVGVEVEIENTRSRSSLYLLPLCKECNSRGGEYDVPINDLLRVDKNLISK